LALLLFDIDGTLLLRAAREHGEAMRAALHAVHGVDTSGVRVETAGRTDPEICRALLLACGVSAARIAERADRVRAAAVRDYARRCPADLSAHVAPGIAALLDDLGARDDVRLALVTGNFEAIARLKLDRAGLGHHFPRGQGGFGSDSEDRSELPAVARRRAGAGGRAHPREDTVVIGDTPRDIACAHADGVRCVAVTTGRYGPQELAGADVVACDPRELRAALGALA
jgi:phosphoglycolate phosphatase-like HAD superfamily hydrolase